MSPLKPHPSSTSRLGQRGISLVELLVGIAVGLFIVAAGTLVTSSQLTDNRALLLETQLQQDLRATADLMTRDLRRAGYWNEARRGVPRKSGAPADYEVQPNPFDVLLMPTENNSTMVRYSYRKGPGAESFGFQLTASEDIRACLSDFQLSGCDGSGWSALTDENTVKIKRFLVSKDRPDDRDRPDNKVAMVLPCANFCPADPTGATAASTDCWPRVTLRELNLQLKGQSVSDSRVTRTLNTSMRMRGLGITIDGAMAATNQSCPS